MPRSDRQTTLLKKIKTFYKSDVGVRHIIVDLVGPYERRLEQVERFGSEGTTCLKNRLS